MEENKAVQLLFYDDRRLLWRIWIETRRLPILLSFLLSGFCKLLERHTRGGERFAWFLIVIASGCPARIVGGTAISLRCLIGRLGVPGESFVLLRLPVTLLLASIVVVIAISRSDFLNHVLSCNYSKVPIIRTLIIRILNYPNRQIK